MGSLLVHINGYGWFRSSYFPNLLELCDPPVALTDSACRSTLLSLSDYLCVKRTMLATVLNRHTSTLKWRGKKLLNATDYKRPQ